MGKRINEELDYIMETIKVNEKEFKIIKLLGKGKGGYSYLVSYDKEKYVVKQIHHEPCEILYPLNINSDYFPTNFIVSNELLWYIDYECNDYMEEWNFENWGIKYWSKTPELIEYYNKNKN